MQEPTRAVDLTRMIGFDTDGRYASLNSRNCSLARLPVWTVCSTSIFLCYLSISCTFDVSLQTTLLYFSLGPRVQSVVSYHIISEIYSAPIFRTFVKSGK